MELEQSSPPFIIFQSEFDGGYSTLALIVFFMCLVFFYGYHQSYYGKLGRGRKGKAKLDGDDKDTPPGLEVLPGPSSWDPTGIVGNGLQLLPHEKTSEIILEWSKQYGDIFKFVYLSQTWVVLNSGRTVQSLLTSSDVGHQIKCKGFYDLAKPYISNGVIVTNGAFCQGQRKILLKSQSYSNLKAFMPILDKHCKLFVSGLETLFQDGKSHQIYELMSSSFIKIICEMITGSDEEQSEECINYHHNLQSWIEGSFYRIRNPWLLLDPIWKLHPLSRKNNRLAEQLLDFSRKRIRAHRQKRLNKPNPDKKSSEEDQTKFHSVLDDLLDAGVEEGQMVDEINTMIFAGHDTTATGVHFFLFCMASNPEIQKECQKEVDMLFEDPQNFKNGTLTFEAASSYLKLIERCVLETLRMFPSVVSYFRTLHSPLTTTYNDKDVVLPIGTNVVVAPYLLQRKPECFPHPEEFDPDRFLPEECIKRQAYTFVPLSAGSRSCLGLKFSMIEMKIIAAYVLRHFSVTTTDKIEDIPLLLLVTLTPAKNFTFQFTKRDI